jgi:hypothetical protein
MLSPANARQPREVKRREKRERAKRKQETANEATWASWKWVPSTFPPLRKNDTAVHGARSTYCRSVQQQHPLEWVHVTNGKVIEMIKPSNV